MIMRGLFGYIFGIILTLINKHFTVDRSPFDIILKLTMGSLLAGAIVGASPYLETLGVIAVLVFSNWFLSFFAFYFPFIDRILSGDAYILYKNNKIQWEEMKNHYITEHDLKRALRRYSLNSLEDADKIFFEKNGIITVIPQKK